MMEMQGRAMSSATQRSEEEIDLRRGPWTVDEDLILMNYITNHGEGRWNSLARCAGLKRTGKSCRLRWLNYLRPDVRRGNITPEEQLLILELHCRWGNRWSKIAQHLPGRTDNEIKNYWRTRVQKHAKQLRCDVNSKQFKDVMRFLWMPRLVERICAASGNSAAAAAAAECRTLAGGDQNFGGDMGFGRVDPGSESSGFAGSLSESIGTMTGSPGMVVADSSGDAEFSTETGGEGIHVDLLPQTGGGWWPEASSSSPGGYAYRQVLPELDQNWWGGDVCHENLWSMEDIWQLLQ